MAAIVIVIVIISIVIIVINIVSGSRAAIIWLGGERLLDLYLRTRQAPPLATKAMAAPEGGAGAGGSSVSPSRHPR